METDEGEGIEKSARGEGGDRREYELEGSKQRGDGRHR